MTITTELRIRLRHLLAPEELNPTRTVRYAVELVVFNREDSRVSRPIILLEPEDYFNGPASSFFAEYWPGADDPSADRVIMAGHIDRVPYVTPLFIAEWTPDAVTLTEAVHPDTTLTFTREGAEWDGYGAAFRLLTESLVQLKVPGVEPVLPASVS